MPITITISEKDLFNEDTCEFISVPQTKIVLEHSLVSISKWESKWHKPFFSTQKKTTEELIDYLRCMTISSVSDPNIYYALDAVAMKQIQSYMEDPMTATTFSDSANNKPSREIVTSEIFYYWMTALNIPFDPCQKWHINKLKTLIQVCAIKNQPQKKMPKSDILKRNSALNAARRKKLGSKG